MLTIARPTVRLAAAGFADQAQRLALFEVERHAVDGVALRRSCAQARRRTPETGRAGPVTSRMRHRLGVGGCRRDQMAAHPMARRRISISSGSISAHGSNRSGHRVTNLQPTADRECSGTLPGIVVSRAALVAIHRRQRRQQTARVRMQRILEELLHRSDLLNFSAVHHHHAIAGLGNHREVVRDQQDRGILPARP